MENFMKNDEMLTAIKRLTTQQWGRFFFAMPVRFTPQRSVEGCDIIAADAARVVIPDSSLYLAAPLYGIAAWHLYGTIGCLDYPGELIPLSVVKLVNPHFDYIKVLHSGQRRQEYERAVEEHFAIIRNIEAVS
jgi:hypothetical protein